MRLELSDVEAIREADGARVHALDWEALGKPTDPTAPSINFEGKTGYKGYKHTNSSLSDAQVLKLWDSVVNSIRLRTTSPARHSEAPPPRTPLGALALTGRSDEALQVLSAACNAAGVAGDDAQVLVTPLSAVALRSPAFGGRAKAIVPRS